MLPGVTVRRAVCAGFLDSMFDGLSFFCLAAVFVCHFM
jgi:hypothetical protein